MHRLRMRQDKSRLPRTRNEAGRNIPRRRRQLVLTLAETKQGYLATFDVGLEGVSA